MASIVTRKNSFAVVYMTTLNGVRKQKWETYHTLPEAVRRKEQLELYHDLRKSKKIGGEVETVAQLMSVYLWLHGVPRWSPYLSIQLRTHSALHPALHGRYAAVGIVAPDGCGVV